MNDTSTDQQVVKIFKWLQESNGYSHCKILLTGQIACIHKLLFTHAVLLLDKESWMDFYIDRWCYSNERDAVDALNAWDGINTKEPQGWHRHPNTGRRRPDGDASQEYINR